MNLMLSRGFWRRATTPAPRSRRDSLKKSFSPRARDEADLTGSESESSDEDEVEVVKLYKPDQLASIGLTCESSEDLTGGAVVKWVGGASRGVLRVGDVIDSINGVEISGANNMAGKVRGSMGELKLTVCRSGKSRSGKTSRKPPPPAQPKKKTPPPLPAHFVRQGMPGNVRFVRRDTPPAEAPADAPPLVLQSAGPLPSSESSSVLRSEKSDTPRRRVSCGDAASIAREHVRAAFDAPAAAARPRCVSLVNGRRFDSETGFEAGWQVATVGAGGDPVAECARRRQAHCERMLREAAAETLPDAPGPEYERTCQRMSADFSVE